MKHVGQTLKLFVSSETCIGNNTNYMFLVKRVAKMFKIMHF